MTTQVEFCTFCNHGRVRKDGTVFLQSTPDSSEHVCAACSEWKERAELEARVGQVWNTTELQRDYSVEGFGAPYVVVTRRADGVRGSLEFTHRPRFYFGWKEDK